MNKDTSNTVLLSLFLAIISSSGAWIWAGSFGAFLFTLPVLWVAFLLGAH
jgi:hypothetical protein